MQRAQKLAGEFSRRQQTLSKSLNAFIAVADEQSLTEAAERAARDTPNKPLSDTFVAVKDNICTSDFPTTCASRGLTGYRSPYDATVVSRIRAAGGVIAGKTNLDEFGMGSHSLHSAFGPVQTESGHSAGGSSGGSAVAVATDQCHVALGTDTGGSVRLPAAFNSILGFKPSYGLVSRWGVVAYANSLDTVGFFAKDSAKMKDAFSESNGHDALDPTSLTSATRKRLDTVLASRSERSKLRFGIPEECIIQELSGPVRDAWKSTLLALQKAGHEIALVSLPSLPHALSAYYILAPAEASSNLAKYDGVRYGQQAPDSPHLGPLYARTRQHGFGTEVRRRILLGAYSLSANAIDNYFMQAQRVRRLLKQDFDSLFRLPNVLSNAKNEERDSGTIDVILMPTSATLPPKIDLVKEQAPLDAFATDVFTVPASLAGLPALSVPIADQIGLQVIGQYGDDHNVLNIGEVVASLKINNRHERVANVIDVPSRSRERRAWRRNLCLIADLKSDGAQPEEGLGQRILLHVCKQQEVEEVVWPRVRHVRELCLYVGNDGLAGKRLERGAVAADRHRAVRWVDEGQGRGRAAGRVVGRGVALGAAEPEALEVEESAARVLVIDGNGRRVGRVGQGVGEGLAVGAPASAEEGAVRVDAAVWAVVIWAKVFLEDRVLESVVGLAEVGLCAKAAICV
ncbi:hypothetical protein FH972_022235 [Carpinus fangiana]|uniref:Glutamyl-tRNA(Gln) amidotransferase subunit A, chloroplastic/mitochondrial n=1 Tax=Carpinus fangiana TaxID=176857 RepID=A0A5N6KRN2_9ROSI|nr:hypothetical protein FH972_022235 [Carpinus fangiana]